MKEEWRPVKGYEDLYEVSNLGNLKSLQRSTYVNRDGGFYKRLPERRLKPSLHHSGYLVTILTKGGKRKNHFVHRLVLEAFVKNDNPKKKTITNHKDENKTNNNVDNLEWCDHQYNNTYGNRIEKSAKKTRKEVVGVCLESGRKFRFKSTAEAEKYGYRHQSVARAARGERKSYKNIKWKYVDRMNKKELEEIKGVELTQSKGIRKR